MKVFAVVSLLLLLAVSCEANRPSSSSTSANRRAQLQSSLARIVMLQRRLQGSYRSAHHHGFNPFRFIHHPNGAHGEGKCHPRPHHDNSGRDHYGRRYPSNDESTIARAVFGVSVTEHANGTVQKSITSVKRLAVPCLGSVHLSEDYAQDVKSCLKQKADISITGTNNETRDITVKFHYNYVLERPDDMKCATNVSLHPECGLPTVPIPSIASQDRHAISITWEVPDNVYSQDIPLTFLILLECNVKDDHDRK